MRPPFAFATVFVRAIVGACLFAAAICFTVAAGAAPVSRASSNAAGIGGLIVFHQDTDAGLGSDPYGAIWTARSDGSAVKRLLGGDECVDCYSSPALSADGSKVAYADFVDSGDNAVFVMNSDGTDRQAVCVSRCDEPVAWSPDGRQLAVGTESYEPGRGARFQVGIFDLKRRRLRVLTKIRGQVDSVDWSPDGTHLAVATDRVLWSIRADGRDPTIVARGVSDPRWSPDGKTLLLHRYPDRRLGTMPISGGNFTPIPQLGAGEAAWSPDGRQILYSDSRGLVILDLASGHIHELNPRNHSLCAHRTPTTWCSDLNWSR